MSPDEIVKVLRHLHCVCGTHGLCKDCELMDTCVDWQQNATGRAADAIEALTAEVERLTKERDDLQSTLDMYGGEEGITAEIAKVERLTRERDAAIADLVDGAIVPCSYCLQNPSNGGGCSMRNEYHDIPDCFWWRGVQQGGAS